MPSPTSRTRPTSRASSLERYWSISVCSTETISSALNLITTSRDDLVPDGFELGTYRMIEHPIADPHHHAADQLGIDFGLQDRLLVKRLAELLAQTFFLITRQGHCTAHEHSHASTTLVAQLAIS